MRKKKQPTEQLVTLRQSDYVELVKRVVQLQITLELHEKLTADMKETISRLREVAK
jgi:hypothetical protein